jgi:hypothetical protein
MKLSGRDLTAIGGAAGAGAVVAAAYQFFLVFAAQKTTKQLKTVETDALQNDGVLFPLFLRLEDVTGNIDDVALIRAILNLDKLVYLRTALQSGTVAEPNDDERAHEYFTLATTALRRLKSGITKNTDIDPSDAAMAINYITKIVEGGEDHLLVVMRFATNIVR